jgi:hypothetical protein
MPEYFSELCEAFQRVFFGRIDPGGKIGSISGILNDVNWDPLDNSLEILTLIMQIINPLKIKLPVVRDHDPDVEPFFLLALSDPAHKPGQVTNMADRKKLVGQVDQRTFSVDQS